MRQIWKEKPNMSSVKRIYREQAEAWKLLPRLFRDRTMTAEQIEDVEDNLLEAFITRSP
jgi:hypothetical protein